MTEISSPFTANDISAISGVPAQTVAALIRGFDEVEKVPVARTAGIRTIYAIIPLLS